MPSLLPTCFRTLNACCCYCCGLLFIHAAVEKRSYNIEIWQHFARFLFLIYNHHHESKHRQTTNYVQTPKSGLINRLYFNERMKLCARKAVKSQIKATPRTLRKCPRESNLELPSQPTEGDDDNKLRSLCIPFRWISRCQRAVSQRYRPSYLKQIKSLPLIFNL